MATDLSEYSALYFKTAKEYLEKLMRGLISLSENVDHTAAIADMYISAHSLKSQSQMMNYQTVSQVAGALEDILREIKEGKRAVNSDAIAFCKQAIDSLLITIIQLESVSPSNQVQSTEPTNVNAVGNGKTIMLIEDDLFLRQFYANKLKEQKFAIETASDGEEGMLKIREKKPDMILLDLIMPKKDGFSVLRDISEDDSLKNIPVIIFSTLGQESDMEKAKTLGAKDYMDKSFFNFEGLLKKINMYIQ